MTGNSVPLPASNPMSSFSGAHYEADLPVPGGDDAGKSPGPQDGAIGPQSQRELDLFRRAQSGDRGAFGQIVLHFQDRLYNAVLRLVGDAEEARELTQETFAKALEKIESFRGESGPYTWLFRIAANLAISQLRKVQRHRTFSLDAGGPNGSRSSGRGARRDDADQASSLLDRVPASRGTSDSPDEVVERRERDQQVVAALGRLDAEYRAVLVMRDVEGFDYQQMADVLGLPLGTLKSRLFRARLALRDELRAYLK
jgi:RNA polymerase sigma-70 factor (ECF subfamily)